MKRYRREDQRRAYAARRVSKAVERLIVAETHDEKLRAIRWSKAWAALAGIRPLRPG